MSYEVVCGDSREELKTIPDASVPLIVADPPYGLRKGFAGDHTPAQALALVNDVLPELARVLKPNGSLYLFAGPQVAARVEVAVGEHLHVLANIRWVKESGWHRKTAKEGLRSYLSPWESIIFAEHPCACVDYEQTSEGIRAGVFESLREYLESERRRAGVGKAECNEACGFSLSAGGMAGHWFGRSQWALPTAEHYASLRRLFNDRGNGSGPYLRREYEDLRREYEDLRREYEDLRREYEDLRRPFSVTADVPYTDVWDFPTVAAYPGKHPCEKPQALLEHIIRTSSRPGDLVLDCFMGGGSTGEAAGRLGRDFLGIEIDESYCDIARARLAHAEAQRQAETPRLLEVASCE